MTRFVAVFQDPVDPAAVAPAVSAAHFAYLEAHQDTILVAGGLRPDIGQPFCGALWILETPDRAAADALVEDDPYRQAGIWSRPSLFAWGKAPFYGPVQL